MNKQKTYAISWQLTSVFVLLAFFVTEYYFPHTGIRQAHNVVSQSQKSTNPNMGKAGITVPDTLQPIKNTLAHTSYIGTPDHPTIEGGMINAADGLLIHADLPVVSVTTKTQDNIKDTVSSGPVKKTEQSFDDNWVNNHQVKKLLEQASQQGKLAYVLKKSTELRLPASVAMVPMIESNYQTHVVSSKGAAGAWQLMPSVAVDYGIKQEDRFDFIIATDTALQLLQHLYIQFGHWDLAFAAYHAGSGQVQKALQQNPMATSIEELRLPQTTKNYVKKLMLLNQTMMDMMVDDA